MKNIYVLPTDKPSRLYYSGNNSDLLLSKEPISFRTFERSPQNIYVTSDEEIKEGDLGTDGTLLGYYGFDEDGCPILKNTKNNRVYEFGLAPYAKKIILTTDIDLINDGVQAIDDDFLEWFVKNPSCEFVKTQYHYETICDEGDYTINPAYWTIIIPKEEPKPFKQMEQLTKVDWEKFKKSPFPSKKVLKQETLEEVAAEFAKNHSIYPTAQDDTEYGFINGAKWQAERMYSEEDMREAFENGVGSGKYQAEYGDNAKGSMNFEYFIKQFKKK